MSDKRPETSADILSRSRQVSSRGGLRAPRARSYSVDLSHHMAECDANYHRLLRLFPALREEGQRSFALAMPSLESSVVFSVIERGPYTTTLKVEVDADDRWLKLAAAPQLEIRVYHDAQSAEVIAYQDENRFHGRYDYPNLRMRQRDEKAQINRFLGEFLTMCLNYGQSDRPVTFPR